VIPLDVELDHTFPRYNPNPEDMEMLHAMADAVKEHGADVALGFDGDGDRCGVVDNEGKKSSPTRSASCSPAISPRTRTQCSWWM
jgi:phosphomannomutase/phosphoglucomutase